MAKNKQKTLYEKWASDSKEPNGGLNFHDTTDTGKMIPMEGFTDEEMKKILGEDGYKRYKQQFDEIEEA